MSAISNVKKSKRPLSQQEIDKASDIDIVQYLLSIGEPIKPDSKTSHYYRHEHHDSLLVSSHKNYFIWNSQNKSGNAIKYLMLVHGLSFRDSVEKINKDLNNGEIKEFKTPTPKYLEEFVYNVAERNTTDNIVNYLVDERKIDRGLVDMLIQYDYIKEDKYRNVVFKWKDAEGNLIGANLQGTREMPLEKRIRKDRAYFKQELPTTKKATFTGFSLTIGYPENIHYFESCIDLLSYFCLHRKKLLNCRLVSMGGLKKEAYIENLKRSAEELKQTGRSLKSVKICVDNDHGGREFLVEVQSIEIKHEDKEIPVIEDIPKVPDGLNKWDWNNELQKHKERTLARDKMDREL
ncbi:DUF3991 domain-containing protein [Bacillus amyloliquefaciens]|uniref:DUF3991 domain-containing protein n=1 Tax=Bacillus amyloliquefaciens TaxID=1390 RepID=UPI000E272108|nr:DUF3991 domain-containing protein [Bacillus amyloliquefaciens]RDY83191.1 hypothetical protein C3733_20245 [Bacillus amyloliquefaciens]